MCCSAPRRTIWACTASRWLATCNCGRDDHRLLLDGPLASRDDIQQERKRVRGRRPVRLSLSVSAAMRVGRHEVYWHRPLVAYLDPTQSKPAVLPDAPLGYLTAYRCGTTGSGSSGGAVAAAAASRAVPGALDLFQHATRSPHRQTALNVRLLLDTWRPARRATAAAFAGAPTCSCPKRETLETWSGIAAGSPADSDARPRLWSRSWSTASSRRREPRCSRRTDLRLHRSRARSR